MRTVEKNQPYSLVSEGADWNGEPLASVAAVIGGFFLTGLPVAVHIFSPIIAIPMVMVLSVLLANYAPRSALISVTIALLFQNFFVSLVSSNLSGPDDFKIIRGYNFVILVSIWSAFFASYWTRFRGQNASIDLIMNLTFGVVALVIFYFLIGIVQNPTPAVIYLRNILTPILIFQIALITFWRLDFSLNIPLVIITAIFLLMGYIELIFREDWLYFTGGKSYWELDTRAARLSLAWDQDARETGYVMLGFLDAFKVDLFNTPLLDGLDLQVMRLMGPNMHAISYSYAVVVLLVFALFRGSVFTALLLLPLLIFANAKGGIILLILVLGAWFAFKLFGARLSFWITAFVLALYATAGILVGLEIGDFHVLGFMGGLYNFVGFPFGHGIGVGGNLGTDFSQLDWPAYQAAGRTPVAIESAVGVLLYQMGPGAFVLLGLYLWLAWQTLRVASFTGKSLHIAASFALLTVLVNGIFQEEALFSPLALGLLISLNGMVLGQAIRKGFAP